jgi:hypothetical protein
MKLTPIAIALTALVGCATTPPPAASTSSDAPRLTSSTATTAARPDKGKATEHLRKHVTYPATRAQILAACANTPEFNAGEKQWFSDSLPEGTYTSADDVIKAVKLE